MPILATLEIKLATTDGDGSQVLETERIVFPCGTNLPKREIVSLTGSAFTALTAPSGAKGIFIVNAPANISLTLKSVTGDTGIAMTPASNSAGLPIFLPVSSPSIGILNGNATARTITIIWV